MLRIFRVVAAISILTTIISYAISHYPADALTFSPSIHIGRGSIRDIDWHPSGEMLTVDTVRGAWIYTDTLTDITHLDILRAHFSPDGEWIAGVNEQHQIVLYDTVNFEPQITLSGHRNEVVLVAWHPTDPNRLASIEENGQLIVWDISTREAVFRDKAIDHIQKMLWSPTGDFLAVMDTLGGIVVWNIATKQLVFSLPLFNADDSATFDIVWNDTDILTRGWTYDGGKIETWSVTARMQVSTPSWQGLQMVMRIAIPSPDQLHLAVIGDWGETQHYGDVGIFDYAGNERLQELPSVYFWVESGTWSPDSTKLVVWDIDSEFYTWDVAHNRRLGKNTIHNMLAEIISWRDDGKIIATGSEINEGHLWDAETGEHLATLTGQKERIHTLAWQPNGTLLVTTGWGLGVSSSQDNIVQIWDTKDIGDDFAPIEILNFEFTIANAAWNSNGTQLSIADNERYVYIWNPDQQTITHQFDLEQPTSGCCDSIFSVIWNYNNLLFLEAYRGSRIVDANSGQVVAYPPIGEAFGWSLNNTFLASMWRACCTHHSSYETLPALRLSQIVDFATSSGPKQQQWTIPLQLTFADFDPTGEFLVGIDTLSNLVTWNLLENKRELLIPDGFIKALFSPNSDLIAAYGDNTGRIIHRKSGRIYGTLTVTTPYYQNTLAFSPDSRRIAAVHDGVLTIYDSTPDCMASIFRPFFESEGYCED